MIELLIVIAIVGILASIAVASYQFAVVKTRRATAEGCLQEHAQVMERHYTTNAVNPLTYTGAPGFNCDADVTAFYVLSRPVLTATTFTLSAQPTAEQNDSKCGTLTLAHTGARGVSGTGTADECW